MPSRPVSTESVARRMLQSSSADVAATEPDALADAPDGVHRHRTRVRRLRAVLAALRRVADPADLEPLRVALAEWGSQLGEVRDAEVRAAHAEAALAGAGIDDADAYRRLVGDERVAHRRLHGRLRELAEGARSLHRRQLLRESGLELHVTGPHGAGVDEPAAEVYARVLRREARRVRRAAGRADGSLEAHHELRKAGRRLRYVAEAVDASAPGLLGDAPRRLAKGGKRIHAALGDHRDLTRLAERAERTRVAAFRAQETTAPYDEIAVAARDRALARLATLPEAVRSVRRAARGLR